MVATIDSIKTYIRLAGNSYYKFMNNDIFDFSVLKFFGIKTRSRKVLQPLWFIFLVFCCLVGSKLTTMVMLEVLLV